MTKKRKFPRELRHIAILTQVVSDNDICLLVIVLNLLLCKTPRLEGVRLGYTWLEDRSDTGTGQLIGYQAQVLWAA